MRDRGLKPTALTPDRLQAAHLARTLPDVPVLRCKFERIRAGDHARRFAANITILDPVRFASEKRYMLLALERA